MSWNIQSAIINLLESGHPPREDVSWNSYLATIKSIRFSHPPREDVSWNNSAISFFIASIRHPPREDVSWNTAASTTSPGMIVILLVRMWVEIREQRKLRLYMIVILLVRMWVEIPPEFCNNMNKLSSSSWGCELKYTMRLNISCGDTSSSSWGCELKYSSLNYNFNAVCHPPREDVSWNIRILRNGQNRTSHPPREDVSWNDRTTMGRIDKVVILLVRMWVEITQEQFMIRLTCHPPREDVSWNVVSACELCKTGSSSSSWGCELKCLYIR